MIGNEEGCRLEEVIHRINSYHVAMEIRLEREKRGGAEKELKWGIRWDEKVVA